MIVDDISNRGDYFINDPFFASGFEFIRHATEHDPPDGRYELFGGAYAMVQGYETAPADSKSPESHRRHIDIQALLSGEEIIEWLPVAGLEVEAPYSAEKDVVFYLDRPGAMKVPLVPGRFAVFFPSDAHKPGVCSGGPLLVRKVVVKVPVER